MKEVTALMKKVHVDVLPRERKAAYKFAIKNMGMNKFEARRFAARAVREEKQADENYVKNIIKRKRVEAERKKRKLLEQKRAAKRKEDSMWID